MCNAVSGITKSDGTIYMPDPATWDHSHTSIAKLHGIPDGVLGDSYARWKLTPIDDDYQSDPDCWCFKLDEQRAPSWWSQNAAAFEHAARRATKRYMDSANRLHAAPGAAASTTGYRAAASTTGEGAAASTTGHRAAASTTGFGAAASTTGEGAAASTTGHRAAASTTGEGAAASTTGYRAAASTTGEGAAALTTGEGAAASTSGDGAAIAVGYCGYVRAGSGGALLCAERSVGGRLIGWAFGVAGQNGLKADQWYTAKGGMLVEADNANTRDADAQIAAAKKGGLGGAA